MALETAPIQKTVLVGDLRTGTILFAIPVASGSWTLALNDPGSIDIKLSLRDEGSRRLMKTITPGPFGSATVWLPSDEGLDEIRAALEPAKSFIAIVAGDEIIQAGPIWSAGWDDGDGTISVSAQGLWSILDRRLIVPDGATPPLDDVVSFTNLSLGTIAKRLVQFSTTGLGKELPIIYPPDVTGTNYREWLSSDLAIVGDKLHDLTAVINGPDIDFNPRFTDDAMGIEWDMRIGQPRLSQGGDDWVIDVTPARSQSSSLTVNQDASAMASTWWAVGGQVDDMPVLAVARDTERISAGFPALEGASSHSSVSTPSVLQSHADAGLAGNLRPWQTWQLRVEETVSTMAMRPGDWVRVIVGGHVFLRDGEYRSRITSVAGSVGGTFLDLDLAATMENR